MGEVGMAWRCLPSSRNEEVSACTPTEKRRGGKSEDVEGYGTGKMERERERREKGGFSRTPAQGRI